MNGWRFSLLLIAFGASLGAWAPPAEAADELDCLIKPEAQVVVSAAIVGVVTEVLVDRGDFVEKGQVVARLENRAERAAIEQAELRATFKAGIEEAEARLAFENRRMERAKELYAKGVMSDFEHDEIQSSRNMAAANEVKAYNDFELAAKDLARAKVALELKTVRSPVSGIVMRNIRAAGEYADPPEIVEIAQIDPLRVEAFAPVSLLGRIVEGQGARVVPEQALGMELHATVSVVDRVVDAASGTFGVRLALPNPDSTIPAGLKCRVVFE